MNDWLDSIIFAASWRRLYSVVNDAPAGFNVVREEDHILNPDGFKTALFSVGPDSPIPALSFTLISSFTLAPSLNPLTEPAGLFSGSFTLSPPR